MLVLNVFLVDDVTSEDNVKGRNHQKYRSPSLANLLSDVILWYLEKSNFVSLGIIIEVWWLVQKFLRLILT